MRFIIRTVQDGMRIPLDKVDEKKGAAISKIMAAGFDYLETQSTLGTLDAMGERIEEAVIVIEAVTEKNYV